MAALSPFQQRVVDHAKATGGVVVGGFAFDPDADVASAPFGTCRALVKKGVLVHKETKRYSEIRGRNFGRDWENVWYSEVIYEISREVN